MGAPKWPEVRGVYTLQGMKRGSKACTWSLVCLPGSLATTVNTISRLTSI